VSITLTTITSTLAFGLGCISSVPAVFWLCLYAFPTIVFVYLYQMTFFVACTVLDEKRVQQRRRDCCIWIKVNDDNRDEQDGVEAGPGEHLTDRLMSWYAEMLLQPWVKALVILVFTALAVVCGISTWKLRQEFNFTDVVPDDSYLKDFFEAINEHTLRSPVAPYVYFRYVDQSDPAVQEQMEQYIEDLVTIDAIEFEPDFFWLRHFKEFVSKYDGLGLGDLDFNAQVEVFLSVPVFDQLFAKHIVRDESGTIIESRCSIYMDNVDLEDIKDRIDALQDQRAITEAQPINAGRKEWAFFSYDIMYNMWEFYATCVHGLIFTTILGVVSVTAIALLFIPHWSAAFFVLPLICVLYVDLLGVMQWAGVSINAVSYVALVMSIGLLVDFIMHILLRYYESEGNRKEKTIATLRTMGASILIGAVSTFFGTLPLAFSTSKIFVTIFTTFLGLITLGASHGLVLLPVVLSMIGPEDHIMVPEARTRTSSEATTAPPEALPNTLLDADTKVPRDDAVILTAVSLAQ
jgi:predicted RND superfamily exporter protein